ncbi:Crp/Fnr family transcriptional regulator [Celeribacter indicus]|uniref:Cyclic nucleotide-binding protein n=1 Tax=Celeribacter indicus TaxID=1208324 RepID=A0A0B5DY74_9RHOB|nr:Crp/Fnr family transcriptional regulator [Celeribacter indicus]AJE45147.1 cyclic nucleotide-binding protein [Celeribacter indicus]SDX26402.1 cAMP-binding domain of CRP or a regulatory subunit of cAMP-dependent protein kinases [Celeribacter indicus]
MIVDRCENCPLKSKNAFVPLTGTEVDFMNGFKKGELAVEAGTTLVTEGSDAPHLYTVLSGMGMRYKTLEDGRRQVIGFILPGDFIGLQASVMGEAQNSVDAKTDMRLCAFQRRDLWTLFERHPDRAYDLVWMSAVEESFLGEALTTLGQRSGRERVAWALVKLFERLSALGLDDGERVPLPFRQQDLADSLGLSLVHTNKTLRALHGEGLATWVDGELEIGDLDALRDIALLAEEGFQPRPLI